MPDLAVACRTVVCCSVLLASLGASTDSRAVEHAVEHAVVQGRKRHPVSDARLPGDNHARALGHGGAGDWLGYRAAPPRPSAREANAKPPKLPFYVARRGASTVYLLGTLHAGYPSDYPANHPFREPILNALNDSPRVAFELSPDDLVDAPASVQKVGYCAYACLPKMIPPSLLRKVAARVGMNATLLKQIDRMRPWLAAMVMESYDSTSSGLQAEYGSEAQLQNNYTRPKGQIVGLETLNEQMMSFGNLTLDEQREMLEQVMAQSPQQNAADLRRIHALWRAGDAERLYDWQQRKSRLLARDQATSDAVDNRIVYRRNRRYVARIVALVTPRRPVFVAVGALHLGGRRGVLALLRAKGYQIRPG